MATSARARGTRGSCRRLRPRCRSQPRAPRPRRSPWDGAACRRARRAARRRARPRRVRRAGARRSAGRARRGAARRASCPARLRVSGRRAGTGPGPTGRVAWGMAPRGLSSEPGADGMYLNRKYNRFGTAYDAYGCYVSGSSRHYKVLQQRSCRPHSLT
jgi:hypothetical protein